MRLHAIAVDDAPTDQQGNDESGNTRGRMHHGPAREVERAELEQPAVRSPNPVSDRRVDEDRPEDGEDHEAGEALALGERACDEGRRDGGEHELERREEDERDRAALGRLQTDVHEPDEVQAAEQAQARRVRREGDREPDQDPDDAHQGQAEEAVHDRRKDVLAPHEATVEKGKAGQHHHDQGRRDEHPGGVAGVDDGCIGRGRGTWNGCQRQGCEYSSCSKRHYSILRAGSDVGLASSVGKATGRVGAGGGKLLMRFGAGRGAVRLQRRAKARPWPDGTREDGGTISSVRRSGPGFGFPWR